MAVTAAFAKELLGWKRSGGKLVPNTADTASRMSMTIAATALDYLQIEPNVASDVPPDPGPALEQLTRIDLNEALRGSPDGRLWDVRCGVLVSEFAQYRHLNALDRLVKEQPQLRVTLGMDYMIKPDVTVGIIPESEPDDPDEFAPFLHAVISCKWTIRSDRVQNIRHEFGQLIRHRRGRQPHLVTLTAEPLPSRLASIARGTGEVDATYHLAFDAVAAAVDDVGSADQRNAWTECVEQGRLRPYSSLAQTLMRY